MKNIALVFVLLFSFNCAFANIVMCTSSGVYFYPQQDKISLNSVFIIEGYAMSQESITNLKTRKVYLESEDGERIELHLEDILVGQMRLTQAIFKPCHQLEPNISYFIEYGDIANRENRNIAKKSETNLKTEKHYWKTENIKFEDKLNADLKIEFIDTSVSPFGCGPATYTHFSMNKINTKEIWIKTELVEIESNQKTTYYLSQSGTTIDVGHGMCSGAFRYENGGTYKVRFTPMNTDGKSLATTDWYIFDSPYLSYKGGY